MTRYYIEIFQLQKKINILFIGLGSAGQRHLRIISKLLKNRKKQIYCYRNTKRNLLIDDNLKTKKVKSVENYYKIKNLSKKLINNLNFDIVYITNPIYKHITYALKFAKKGSNLFLEKPVSHNLNNINSLKKIILKKKITVCVGYQLRFHPGIELVKNVLENNDLGTLISADFHFGEFLPNMHKYEDYSLTHMAQKKQGGGAVLCLSHEVDLVRYLLGEPTIIKSKIQKKSRLKINVEDTLTATLKTKSNAKIRLNINFLDNPTKHFIKLKFKRGDLFWNYIDNYLEYANKILKKKKKIHFSKFKRNDMFTKQAKNFLNSIYKKENLKTNIDEGIKTLRLCLKLKKWN